MNRFLLALLVIALAVVALGFYLDWFGFSKTTDKDVHFNVRVDPDKIKRDVRRAGEQARELGQQAREEIKELGEEAREVREKVRREVTEDSPTLQGRIKEVDNARGRMVLTTTDIEDVTVHKDRTQAAGTPDSWTNLRVGDDVRVTYKVEDGKRVATAVVRN